MRISLTPQMTRMTFAIFVLLLSVMVIVGWYLHIPTLIQVLPSFVAMQINTAICFLLMSVAILSIIKFRIITVVFSSVVFAVCLATLFQYIFNVDFKIDQLVMEHYIVTGASHPGRMAPNTALCFCLLSLSCFVLALKKSKVINKVSFILGCLVFTLSFVVLIGYAVGLSTEYGWGKLTAMAVHTSVSFIVLSLGLLPTAWKQSAIDLKTSTTLVPVLLFFMITAFFGVFWYMLSQYEVMNAVKTNVYEAKILREQITAKINYHLNVIDRLFQRVDLGRYTSKKQYQVDAANYLKTMPSLILLSNYQYLAIRDGLDQTAQQYVNRCKQMPLGKLSKVRDYALFTAKFNQYVCIRTKQAKQLVFINVDQFVSSALSNNEAQLYNVQVVMNEYEKNKNSSAGPRAAEVVLPLTFFGFKWQLRFTNFSMVDKQTIYWFPLAFLFFGVLFAFLLSTVIRLLQASWIKSINLQQTIKKQKEADQTLNTVVDSSPDAIIIINQAGRIIFSNRKAETLSNYSHDDLSCLSLEELIPERFRRNHRSLRRAYSSSPSFRRMGEGRIFYLLDGHKKEIPVEISLMPIKIKEQNCIMCTILDVTDRQRQDEKIKKQTKNLQLIHDVTNYISDCNDTNVALQACIDMVCENLSWEIGHAYKVDPNDDEKLITAGLWFMPDKKRSARFKATTEKTTFTKGVGLPGRIWASRRSIWIDDVTRDQNFPRAKLCPEIGVSAAVGFPIMVRQNMMAVLEFFSFDSQAQDDEILRTLDILAEQVSRIFERKFAQDELAESEAKFRMLLDSAGEGIYGIDMQGKVTFANKAACAMLGYEVVELIDQPIHALVHHHYSDGAVYPDNCCPINLTLTQHNIVRINDEVFWTKAGEAIWVEYICSPVVTEAKIDGAVVIFSDISERKKAEERLTLYAKELERSNQELDNFAYVASHDLKEPLRGINNTATFLIEDYKDKIDKLGVARLKKLQKLTHTMEDLIQSLLCYSRVGRADAVMTDHPMGSLLDDAVEIVSASYEMKHITIVRPKDLPVIKCDKEGVIQIFQNLIANAIKYNDSEKKHIKIECREEENVIQISINDNGIGIEDVYQGKIFDIFQRLHNKDEYGGGSGTGLSIVKKIVERHGGNIWLRSKPTKGTTFYFTLVNEVNFEDSNIIKK